MKSNLPLIGLVLAGGRSSRMGQDKAALELGGQTLLARAQSLLADCGARDIVILGNTGIPDKQPFSGPARAIADWIGAQQDRPCRILVLPVDMPYLTKDALAPLIEAPNGAYFADHFLPFTARLPKHVAEGPIRVRDLLRAIGVEALPLPESHANCFLNMNTPADLARIQP